MLPNCFRKLVLVRRGRESESDEQQNNGSNGILRKIGLGIGYNYLLAEGGSDSLQLNHWRVQLKDPYDDFNQSPASLTFS